MSSSFVKPLCGLVLSLSLISCTGVSVPPVPKSPAQAVYELKTAEAAALTIAVKYKNLPPCPTTVICSDASVVSKLQSADQTARAAIDTAENFSRGNFSSQDVQSAINLASRALSALTGVTSGLRTN